MKRTYAGFLQQYTVQLRRFFNILPARVLVPSLSVKITLHVCLFVLVLILVNEGVILFVLVFILVHK